MIQLPLTAKMTNTQASAVTVTVSNSPIQDYDHPGDHASPTYEMTPTFKLFTQKNVSPFKMTSLLTIYLSFIFS